MRFKQKIILCLFFSLSVLLIYLPANYFTWFKVSLDDVEEIAETIVEVAPEAVVEEIVEEEVPEVVEEIVVEERAEELESELAGEVESEISEEDSIVDNQEVVENYTEGDLFTEEEALDSVNTTQTIQQEDLAIGTGENKQVEDVNENLLNQVEQLLLKLNQDELEILKFKFFDVITEEKDDVYGGTNENTQFFREFNNYQIEKAQDKKQEDEKTFDVYKNFLKDYFGKDNFTNNFEKLNEKIYFFEDDLLDSGRTLIRRNKEEEIKRM